MKKVLLVCVAFLALSLNSNAQEKGAFSGFVGGTYLAATGGTAGVNAGVEYMITDALSVAPSYSYFFKADAASGVAGVTADSQNASINVDVRYYLGGDDSLKYYGTAGVSLASIKATATGGGQTVSTTASKTGLNVGGGLIYALSDSMGLIGQVTYNTPFAAVVPMVAINFNF